MATLGIEMCDAGFRAASAHQKDSQLLSVADPGGALDWPGFAYYDGQKFFFGRAAEDQWFVHPRRVTHGFWPRLAHEPSTIGPAGKPASFSELSFHFLRAFTQRASAAFPAAQKIVLAVPGGYLKDAATEEEKIGLVLGMAGELKLPLAGLVDMACAALCDPHSGGFNPALPIAVVDLQLDGADVTLLTTGQRLERKDFIHLPHSGFAQLLKHLTGTMGNRFLRHTAFDILEDGRIEQMFFRQTKDFLLSGAAEHRFQINTATRAYEMLGKREQLAADAQPFVHTLVQSVHNFIAASPHASEPCTIALTDRTAHLPGIEARFRHVGLGRVVRLTPGAAAAGAARLGEDHLSVPADLADVAVETTAPLAFVRRAVSSVWEARLQKLKASGPRLAPTHVILDGVGHPLGHDGRFTIGAAAIGADLTLPESFNNTDDCAVPLVHEDGRLWFVENSSAAPAARTAVDAGDRITIRCGSASADVLFAHCTANGGRARA
ncbi:MAG TPA: hypothetical protein VHD62_02845 [Opitutaceae bacterium]|nr:hypothetical protein [Opitutaceae bacterium]